jgi:hypothetical protein
MTDEWQRTTAPPLDVPSQDPGEGTSSTPLTPPWYSDLEKPRSVFKPEQAAHDYSRNLLVAACYLMLAAAGAYLVIAPAVPLWGRLAYLSAACALPIYLITAGIMRSTVLIMYIDVGPEPLKAGTFSKLPALARQADRFRHPLLANEIRDLIDTVTELPWVFKAMRRMEDDEQAIAVRTQLRSIAKKCGMKHLVEAVDGLDPKVRGRESIGWSYREALETDVEDLVDRGTSLGRRVQLARLAFYFGLPLSRESAANFAVVRMQDRTRRLADLIAPRLDQLSNELPGGSRV